jgi:transitional endoplasmic reticulum ATPase
MAKNRIRELGYDKQPDKMEVLLNSEYPEVREAAKQVQREIDEMANQKGKTLDEAAEPIINAEIVKTGDKLIVPEGVSLRQAKALIERRMSYEEEEVSLSESFDVFPWDGAHAFDKVLTAVYGWTPAEAQKSFWGDIPPKMIAIDTGPRTKAMVPWGNFSLPNVEGILHTDVARKDGRLVFQLSAEVKRVSQQVVEKLFAQVRDYLKTGSIYRGKAIRMRFLDDDGDVLQMPEPKFMDTDDIDPSQLVYSRTVQASIDTNLFTPIQRVRELKANGIPVKRGVLLGGAYGCGKTLAARAASKYAVDTGVTFLYVTRADELSHAISFARQYQDPACVIFCEDIDRVMNGERSVAMDDILNIVDGIDSKASNLIVVLTTNNLDGIHPAMLRPGRLDSVIEVKAPDAEAVEKLLRYYGGNAIGADEDLSGVAAILDGEIPAVVAEVVQRAKLSQLRLNPPGVAVTRLTAEALEDAAQTMTAQLELLAMNQLGKPEPPALTVALQQAVRDAIEPELAELKEQVANVENYVSN